MKRGGAVYMMTNLIHTTLYVGVTANLKKRVLGHKNFIFPESFTSKYKLTILVYYEGFHRIEEAIAREKKLKDVFKKTKRTFNKFNESRLE